MNVRNFVSKKDKELVMKININQFKQTYYYIPWGESTTLPDEVTKKGEDAILKKLIYLGALSIFKYRNEINAQSLEEVFMHYDLHWYKDTNINRHPHTHIRSIGGIQFLSRLDEDKYIDQIEMATHEFRVKNAFQSTMDQVLEEFQALLTSDRLEDDCARFADNHLSTEHVTFEIRHERMKAEGFDACKRIIYDIVRHARQFEFRSVKIRFIGHQCRPHGIKFKSPKDDKVKFYLGFSTQEENQKGLFITIRDTYEQIVLFDLDDNNKVTHITIIRGSMLNLYNVASYDSEFDDWR